MESSTNRIHRATCSLALLLLPTRSASSESRFIFSIAKYWPRLSCSSRPMRRLSSSWVFNKCSESSRKDSSELANLSCADMRSLTSAARSVLARRNFSCACMRSVKSRVIFANPDNLPFSSLIEVSRTLAQNWEPSFLTRQASVWNCPSRAAICNS